MHVVHLLSPYCVYRMPKAVPIRYQVVFWDSEAQGFEGNRIQFSEQRLLPIDTTKALPAAWRSDRRCHFPVEIGLRLQAPCRLDEIVIVSEPALAPTAVQCFVAGPTRSRRESGGKRTSAAVPGGIDHWHNGSTKAWAEAERANYLSSVFVRAGRADFSRAKAETVTANGEVSSRTDASRQKSNTSPTGLMTAVGAGVVAPSVAVLSGLTFKGQFLRLVLWEAAGSSDNPGRQVSVAGIQILGLLLSDEHGPKAAGNNLQGTAPSLSGEGEDRELEQALLDLGIEPLLAQCPLGEQQARALGERGQRDVSRGLSGGFSLHASNRKGWEGEGQGAVDAEDAVAAEATMKVKRMLHIARTEERFYEAEMLSLQLDRVRSLASTLCLARSAQKRAARRENFDQAKIFRDNAREAEVWLLQTVRDASDMLNAGGDGRLGRQPADRPLAADTSPETGTNVPSGTASTTLGTGVQELAPSHDPGHRDHSREKTGESTPNDLAAENVRRRSNSGDGSKRGTHDEERLPWLTPSCAKATEPWRALLKLPWPGGVQPDFRTVFSHKWVNSTMEAYRHRSAGTGHGGGSGGGGGSTPRFPLQPGGLLRTILRLVAASQDLRPPGPVPPDAAPFRQAGSAYGRPPLCTFLLPPAHVAGGEDGGGETAEAGENIVPGSKSNNTLTGQIEEVSKRVSIGGRKSGAAINGDGPELTEVESEEAQEAADLLREGNIGRAFGHSAADSSPAATHVVNFIEDNANLVWSSVALRDPRRHSVQHLRHAGRNGHDSARDKAPAANESEASEKSVNGKRRRSPADEDGKEAEGGARMRSKKRGGGERTVDHETEVPAVLGKARAVGERFVKEAASPLKPAAAVLPDIVGAGGFAEFIPLLDTIFGRVPMSAACAGFPARIRETSIRLCQAHLDLTADTAVEAYVAAAGPTSIGTGPTSSSRNLSSPGSRTEVQLCSEAGSKRGSQAESSGELKVELESSLTIVCNNDRDGQGSSSSSSTSSAIGAVVRAACLVAAQGLMDPEKEVRLAGADLARSALSLWSSAPATIGDEAEETGEAESGALDTTACLPPKAATSDSAKIDSKPNGRGSSARSSVSGSAANNDVPEVRAAVPLRDLRWGLELVLACVAPYLTNRAVESDERKGDRVMTTTGGGGSGSVSKKSGRRSTNDLKDSRSKTGSSPDENIARDPPDGEGGGSRNGCNFDDTEEREEFGRAVKSPLYEEGGERSLLALRVVDFACRHPDIGPALVASVLVGWIPCLAQWGCNTPPAASPAGPKHTKGGRASIPHSPRCAAFTAGEAAASEMLASGAIEMIVYMVQNFPLLPLSDFSAERLVAAAEGGMAFAGRSRPTSAGEQTRNGAATGGWSAAAAARGARERGQGVERPRRSRRSSTNGRAQKAGEALMLELFLRTGGGGHGGLYLGLDCCLDSLLPALNTARGINFLDKTAGTADLLVSSTAHECETRAIKWPSQRRPFVAKVEVRQRLELPPTPSATTPRADGDISSTAVSNDHAAALENGNPQTSTLKKGSVNVCHLARHDTSPGVYPHMSDSSSAEGLSASTGKSAATSVLSKGDGAAAPSGVHKDDDSSSFASFSHGSLSSTSEDDRGSDIDSTSTGREPREGAANTKKKQAATAAQASAEDGKSVKQTVTADGTKKSNKVFPIEGIGSEKGNDVHELERKDVGGETSVVSAKKAAEDENSAATPAGETKAKKGGGGFVSRLFGRGKK